MVSTISLAVQEKEEQNMSVLNIEPCNDHYNIRLKTTIHYIFTLGNRFRIIYCTIILACIIFFFWSPLMDPITFEDLAASFPAINGTSALYRRYDRALSQRCSLSPTISVDNISSYTYMNLLNVFICIVTMVVIMTANGEYHSLRYDYLNNSYRWFRMFRNIFIYLTVSCVCNQLVSAFACRSINILYDLRFISIVIVQICGFFVCLFYAFLVGVKYASLNHA